MPTPGLVAKPEKVANPKKSKGAVKRPIPREQPNRKMKVTQRYSIDVIMAIEDEEKIPEKETVLSKRTNT